MMVEGEVEATVVIEVLKARGVEISQKEERTIMIKGEVIEVQRFPRSVPRRMVLRLAHKFKVEPHYFWHPEMMPGGTCDPSAPSN